MISGDVHIYIHKEKERERDGAHNDAWQWEHMQERKRGREREAYLKLGLIKQYRAGGRCVLLMLRLQKREDKRKGISQQVHGVSYKKALHQKKQKKQNKKKVVRLEITYSPLSSGRRKMGRCLPFTASGLAKKSISKWS